MRSEDVLTDARSPEQNSNDSGAPYPLGVDYLLHAIQALSLAHNLQTVQDIVRHAARRLTGCDGATFVLREGEQCYYADEDAITPLWKGKRFPLDLCVSGWAMLHRRPVIIPDIYTDPRIPIEAYRPTFVKSLVMVPVRSSEPVGAIGNYWATPHQPSRDEVQLLQALADSTSIALENVQMYRELEDKVCERTQELQQALEQIRHLSLTDELTGLYNRRGFKLLAEQTLRRAARCGDDCTVAFMDLDGLKQVNDQYGHGMGDAMIVSAARILQQTFRESDIVGRLGGDEFCVLALGDHNAYSPQQRLQQAVDTFNQQSEQPFRLSCSLGFVRGPVNHSDTLDDLLRRADQCMYTEKATKARANTKTSNTVTSNNQTMRQLST
jgi:diguanylate cyclase (GGDEF)-like protein